MAPNPSHRDVTSPAPPTSSDVPKKVRRRSAKRRRGFPAPVTFYLTAVPAAATAGLAYVRGQQLLPLALASCVLVAFVLFVNDRKGFPKSKRKRRGVKGRRHFSEGEQLTLIALLMLNAFVAAQALFR